MSAEVEEPPARSDVADPSDFIAAVADAYRACVLGGVDMRAAVVALESIREAADRNPEAFPTWRELDDQIGRAIHGALAGALVALRGRYEAALLARWARWPEAADFDAWVALLGRALGEWRISLCEVLVANPPTKGLAPGDEAEVAALPQRIAAMKLGDWDQSLPALEWVGRQPRVADLDRARILARAAQVDLYFAGDIAAAHRRLDAAAPLATSPRASAEVECVRGQCFIEAKDTAKAIERLEFAAGTDSRFVESFGYRGDVALAANDLVNAESWYRRALSAQSGSTTGYMRLARLFARPELFAARRSEIAALVDRAVMVVPLEAATNLADAADASREAGDLEGALHFAGRAVEYGPDHGRSYYARALVHAAQDNWELALADFRQALACEPSRYAKTRWYAMGAPQALDLLLREFDRQPDDAVVRDALLCYVEQSNGIEDRLEPALSVLAALEQRTAPSDTPAIAVLANARGDLHFWRKDYASAAEGFRSAWTLAPQVPLYANNLVTTLRWLPEWDEAERVIAASAATRADPAWRDSQLAAVANDRANALFAKGLYSEAATSYAGAAVLAPENATYRSNQARAIDQAIAGAVTSDALEHAASALESACELRPDDAGFRARLDAVRHMRAGASRYGIQVLQRTPIFARIRIAKNLTPWVSPDGIGLGDELAKTVAGMRSWFQQDLGVLLPGINFFEEDSAPDGQYELELFGVTVRRHSVRTDRRLLTGEAVLDQARERGFHGEATSSPLNGDAALWIDEADWGRVAELGFPLWALMEYPLYDLSYNILRRLKDLVGHTETRDLLEKYAPPSASRFHDDPVMMTRLVQVLHGLLAERVPIKAFADIAEHVAAAPTGPIAPLVQGCRMLAAVRDQLPGRGRDAIRAEVPAELEAAVAARIHRDGAEPVLAIPSSDVQSVLATLRGLVSERPNVSALVVSDPALRPCLRRIVELAYPQLWVLARCELDESGATTAAGAAVPASPAVAATAAQAA